MSHDIVVGCQWGDEGKGKVVDFLAAENNYDSVVRFQGGPNAGHTVYHGGKKYQLHHVPSGVFSGPVYLGPGMVINLAKLKAELDDLGKLADNVFIDPRAHLIQDHHVAGDDTDLCREIGTTKQGVGPCYTEKYKRTGVRARSQVTFRRAKLAPRGPGRRLYEGQLGVMRDINFGIYPHVTSSTVLATGVCSDAGIPYNQVGRVIGVVKAYTSRSGGGHFPCEHDGDGIRFFGNEKIAEWGEYGATTGRERQIGAISLPELKYAHSLNGFTDLALTCVDRFHDDNAEIPVITEYTHDVESAIANDVWDQVRVKHHIYVNRPMLISLLNNIAPVTIISDGPLREDTHYVNG